MPNNLNNRVLVRKGAREMTEEEVNNVGGGGHVTTTFCTAVPYRDGDDD